MLRTYNDEVLREDSLSINGMLGALVTVVAFSICVVAWKVLGEVNLVFHKVSQLQESAAAVHLDMNPKKEPKSSTETDKNIRISVGVTSFPLQVHSPRRRLPSSQSQSSLHSNCPSPTKSENPGFLTQSPSISNLFCDSEGLKKMV